MKSNFRRLAALAAAVLMLVSLFAGCASKTANDTPAANNTQTTDTKTNDSTPADSTAAAEPTEVVVWHCFTENQLDAFQKIVDDFNASQSEVVVTVQAQPYNDWDTKVMQAVRNGTGPDIIFDYPSTVAHYVNDGFVVNLSKYVDDPEIGIEGFKDSLSASVYAEATQFADGGLYCMPVCTTGTVLFYNKTMYDELGLSVPTTWEEMAENCKAIYEAKGIPGFGYDSLVDGAQIILMQAGSQYADLAAGKVDINTESTVAAYQWFADQVNAGYFKLQPDDYFSTEYGAGAIASFIGSAAGYSYVVDAVGDSFEQACAPIPQGSTKWAPAWNRGLIAFTSDEATERASYLFMKYFVTPEVNKEWCEAFSAVSPYTAVASDADFQSYLSENPALLALNGELDAVGYIPAFDASSTVRDEISKALQEASTGIKTAETALADAEAVCNAEMAG